MERRTCKKHGDPLGELELLYSPEDRQKTQTYKDSLKENVHLCRGGKKRILNFEDKLPYTKNRMPSPTNADILCRLQPAYSWRIFGHEGPCLCEPLRDGDDRGWVLVKRKHRVKKVKKNIDLELEADLDNWEDVDHYGKATYVKNDTGAAYEHNGALFDIGSRF